MTCLRFLHHCAIPRFNSRVYDQIMVCVKNSKGICGVRVSGQSRTAMQRQLSETRYVEVSAEGIAGARVGVPVYVMDARTSPLNL